MKAFFFLVFLSVGLSGFSQHEYFVFINTENQQPFYVQMEEKTFSSSSIGHVILPKLKDSAYQVTIGFPKSQYPEMDFMIRIGRKDHGYLLKNMTDRGWVLFDLQSLELISPLPKKNSLASTGYNLVKKEDNFAKLMAQVVSDTAVLYAIVPAEEKKSVASITKEEKKVADTAELVKRKGEGEKALILAADSAGNNQETAKKEPENLPVQDKAKDTVSTDQARVQPRDSVKEAVHIPVEKKTGFKEAASPELVEKKMTDTGYVMVIRDEGRDIDVFIPVDRVKVQTVKEEKSYANADSTVKKPERKEEDKMKHVDGIIQADTTNVGIVRDTATVVQEAVEKTQPQKKLVLVNSDCKNFATDLDVDKLRVKMLAEKDEDEKISVARKLFRSKCFTTAQVKALTELFYGDEGKYRFLDAAYPFVYDSSNFRTLVSLLTDEYYVKRFRAMVRMD